MFRACLMACALCLAGFAGACSCDTSVEVGVTGDSSSGDGQRADGPADDQALHFDAFASDGKKLDKTGADTGLPLPLPSCRRTCKTSDDCCGKPPCDKGKDAVRCQAGLCQQVGCKSDADCVVAGAKVGTCKQIKDISYGKSYGLCGKWCTLDSDCSKPDRCVARLLASGDSLCGTACTKDSDCLATLACIEGKFCGRKDQRLCKSDSQCPAYSGLLRCYLNLGRCYCDGDTNCQTALGPLRGGTCVCR